MKRIPSRRIFTMALAALLCGAMTPCISQAQPRSQSTTATSSHAAKHKSKREARKERKEEAKTQKEQGKTESSSATEAKSHHWMHHEQNPSASKTEAQTHETASAKPPSAGMVWVNTNSKVYHKADSKWAGKTKHGKWMSEQEAVKDGYKAAKN